MNQICHTLKQRGNYRVELRQETTFFEVLPSLSFGWFSDKQVYIAWGFWNIIITKFDNRA